MASGHIELDRAVDSIRVGYRHRHELGDLDELAASIRQLGLLQPITISPDGVLICGARRLAAVKTLGWKHVNVWVRSGISTELERLLAEQHENVTRKPLSPTEAATLYQELKALMAEDAARRQRSTRFGAQPDQHTRSDGPATVAAPSGDSRAQAAAAVTGTRSYTTLERASEIQRIATDPSLPEKVRRLAGAEITAMDADGSVAGHYHRVKAAAVIAELERLADDPLQPRRVRDHAARAMGQLREHDKAPVERARLAKDALRRLRAEQASQDRARANGQSTPIPSSPPARPVKRYGVRAFLLMWDELDGWTADYNPGEIGPALTADQWSRFEATVAATVSFADAARVARMA
ncbi:ParB N-terminal domain-containing protein [Jiangella muralis]|uniref:ParB N-terminal domain-containing protein n=1 Tax=Jiangella muralis TaxID=702383 RepID=UPI00069F8993|nr:ParB N-terminal domain-containing protein [Jiangella muralis]